MPSLSKIAAMITYFKGGLSRRHGITGGCLTVAGGLYWAIHSTRPGLSRSYIITGVLLGSTGIALGALCTFKREKPEKDSPEVAVENPPDVTVEAVEIATQPQKVSFLLPFIHDCLHIVHCQMNQLTNEAGNDDLLRTDIGVQLDAVTLNCPDINDTCKLYIEMFRAIAQEVQLNTEEIQTEEIESLSLRVCHIICSYMPKIDMSHSERAGSYSIELINYDRIKKAFEVLVLCNVNNKVKDGQVGEEEAIQRVAEIKSYDFKMANALNCL